MGRATAGGRAGEDDRRSARPICARGDTDEESHHAKPEQSSDQAGPGDIWPYGLVDIKPRHIYQYIDLREAKTAARREMELLSHALTKAWNGDTWTAIHSGARSG